METSSSQTAQEDFRTGGTAEEAGEGTEDLTMSENVRLLEPWDAYTRCQMQKLNHQSRYIINSQASLNADPNIDELRNELAELKMQFQVLRDGFADIKRRYEKPACDSSSGATESFPQNRDHAIPASPGRSAAQITDKSEHLTPAVDRYVGVEHLVKYRVSGSFKHDPIQNPLLGKRDKRPTNENWLKVTEHANSRDDSGLDINEWTITIAERALIACLKGALKSYIDHTGRKVWEASQVTLRSSCNPIVLNWRRILQLHNSMSDNPSRDETVFSRLSILMDYMRHFYPSATRIQEKWESSSDIEWKDIGILFVPGSLIVANWTHAGPCQVRKAPQVLKVDHISHKEKEFFLRAWLWDWNGKTLTRTMYELVIPSYEELRRINDLPFYPIEFFTDKAGQQGIEAVSSSEQYRSRKDLFIQYTFSQKAARAPLRYDGDVLGRQISDIPEFRVLFDYARNGEKVAVQKPIKIVLDAQNYVRKGGGRRFLGNHCPVVNSKICSCSLCIDPETKEWMEDISTGKQAKPSTNDLLLAPRVFGYALARKMWVQFALDKIETVIIAEDEGFGKELILPEEVQRDENDDIKHMVKYHMNVMSKPPRERIGDTIGGNGESLILLFHGHSGTGKTLYAESLARWSEKSLLKVGTSDIGQDLARAETKLKEIFELAEAWNVVLLIDEADVLLDARGGSNEGALTKNALVSVLLREVEYFKGVLILTTNRVVAFDPVVLSRVHHAVNFTALTPNLQNAVWKLWLGRLEEKKLCIDDDRIDTWVESLRKKGRNAGFPLNGREIRNIFILAQTLAYQENGDCRTTLEHINRAYHYKVDFRQDTESQRQMGVTLLANKLGPRSSN